jgi:5-oxoprolinase (ATP-hydrolysing) subunit A
MPADWDVNIDLGEGEPWPVTRALLASATSVNVACGGHAGDAESVQRIMLEVKTLSHPPRLGAHPGIEATPGDFGRGLLKISAATFRESVCAQLAFFDQQARGCGVPWHHIKLHGSLYHATDTSPELAEALIDILESEWPGHPLIARAGGPTVAAAQLRGVPVWAELFAERGYAASGALVPRGQSGATLTAEEAARRLRHWMHTGVIHAVDGTALNLVGQTWCVHGDGPECLEITATLQALRKADQSSAEFGSEAPKA